MSIAEKIYDLEQRFNALFSGFRLVSDDTWSDTGALSNSWGKGSGFFKYRKITPGVVIISAQGLTPGTVADGTVICSAANGLPGAYSPATPKSIVADTNALKTSPVNGATFENARLTFNADGSITCSGFNVSATYCNCSGIFDINI